MAVTYSRSKLEPNGSTNYVDAHTGELLHVDFNHKAERGPLRSPLRYPPPPAVIEEL